MTNEFLTFLFFFVPIVLFGLSLMVFYSIGIVKTNPEMTKLALISLISFSISVFASEFFYGKDSMCDMTKAIAFSMHKGCNSVCDGNICFYDHDYRSVRKAVCSVQIKEFQKIKKIC